MARKKQNSSVSIPNGRKRTISPGFFTDAMLLGLSPLHRIFFVGLWAYADREGRVLDRPIDLKIRILPMDAFDPFAGLEDLRRGGLIARYEVDGQRVIAMKPRPWREVQRLHPDEPESALPAPPEGAFNVSHTVSVIGNASVDPISVHGNVIEVPPETHSRLGIFVPAGSAGSSGSSSEGSKKKPRAPSASEELWTQLEAAREARCDELGIPYEPEPRPAAAKLNTSIARALARSGFKTHEVDHPTQGRIELTAHDQLGNLFGIYLADEQLGRFDKDGELRDRPWPIVVFLLDWVIDKLNKANPDRPRPEEPSEHIG